MKCTSIVQSAARLEAYLSLKYGQSKFLICSSPNSYHTELKYPFQTTPLGFDCNFLLQTIFRFAGQGAFREAAKLVLSTGTIAKHTNQA